MTAWTLFGQPPNPQGLTTDPEAYTFGMQFTVSQGCPMTAVWWWSPTGAGALPQTIALYAVTGATLVHSETPTWSGAAGSGWVRAPFSSPPSLTASTNYKVCVFYDSVGANWYGGTADYWTSGPGDSGLSNGPIAAPDSAGGDGGQDTFTQASVISYPSSSFNGGNYWVDVEVTVATPPVSTPGVLYSMRSFP